ncbi:type II toxin-antitoxin system VapC family toxin [Microlunatus speluncae]|uniref:type II toxin-antitoxin system VapC family toxin n=1 Tax=Microlunatus speluncae TaxID=2594267 RepID=UPI001375BCA2|nr:type II toxin-antitoxin system VapC family toxin [Microlunatus speluncae]
MIEGRALIDSAVPTYALGDDSSWKQRCLSVLRWAATGRFMAFASVEMIQELVHHRLRRTGDRSAAAADGRDVASLCTVLAFDVPILDAALHLIEHVPTIRGRDAVHAATALVHGIDVIVSPDSAFDGILGLRRIDPASLTDPN